MVETLQLEGQKEYEVSFWLTAEEAFSEVENIITSAKMTLVSKIPLSSLRLAYPIKKHNSAFWGSCIFSGLPENLKQVETALSSNPKILRILITVPLPKVDNSQEKREASDVPPLRFSKPSSEFSKPVSETATLSNEGLEKKLEEILS